MRREVEEAREHQEDEPEEFVRSPAESDHGIADEAVHQCLARDVDDLYAHLVRTEIQLVRRAPTSSGKLGKTRRGNWADLSEGVGECRVHPRRSLAVEDRPLNGDNWLHRRPDRQSEEKRETVDRAHEIQDVLLGAPARFHLRSDTRFKREEEKFMETEGAHVCWPLFQKRVPKKRAMTIVLMNRTLL